MVERILQQVALSERRTSGEWSARSPQNAVDMPKMLSTTESIPPSRKCIRTNSRATSACQSRAMHFRRRLP